MIIKSNQSIVKERSMDLREFVLTYKGEDGTPLVSIARYYEDYIKPLDIRFKDYSFDTHRTVICCFKDHEDVNPSLGTIPHRHLKGVRVFHCFGCGASGDVVRLHQRIQRDYFNKILSDKESALDLCRLYGINAVQYEDIIDTSDQSGYARRLQKVSRYSEAYTLRDFEDELMVVREHPEASLEDKVDFIGRAMIKQIAVKKGLVD